MTDDEVDFRAVVDIVKDELAELDHGGDSSSSTDHHNLLEVVGLVRFLAEFSGRLHHELDLVARLHARQEVGQSTSHRWLIAPHQDVHVLLVVWLGDGTIALAHRVAFDSCIRLDCGGCTKGAHAHSLWKCEAENFRVGGCIPRIHQGVGPRSLRCALGVVSIRPAHHGGSLVSRVALSFALSLRLRCVAVAGKAAAFTLAVATCKGTRHLWARLLRRRCDDGPPG
mmetsp:Transcript_54582/g.116623  ORF Transcript_54582/g.116623 Transcript_54582/m.116623 type:complete len:226 (+) Transcript_54582:782-1459(+)